MDYSGRKLIVIAGPTAVGKTELSIRLAKALDGEIISADSVQVYKKLNIGSAKITPDEMQGVRHHLIDILEPDEEFNVTVFQKLVNESLDDIYGRGKIPILVGGTGFYIQAILKQVDFDNSASDASVRKELEALHTQIGTDALFEMLKEIDPESAGAIPKENVKRVIRAIEYYRLTGEKISVHNAREASRETPFDLNFFVLNDIRDNVYSRIEKRVDIMLEKGLLEEVRVLYESGISRQAVSMQSLGYRQLLDYFYGDVTLDEAIAEIKLQTRHFAKRQITFFKREKEAVWINKNEFNYDENAILSYMLEVIR